MKGDQILQHLYRVSWWDLAGPDTVDADCFAIDCGDRVVLIDASSGGASFTRMCENLAAWGLLERVTDCLLTHYHGDHARGAAEFQEQGVKMWGGEGLDAFIHSPQAVINFNGRVPQLDHVLKDGETFTLGNSTFQALATPGHTDSCVTYLVTIDGIPCAFTGDMFMVNGTIGYSGSVDFNAATLLASLERLLQADFQAVFTGHMLAASQPEGFWLQDGKAHLRATVEAGWAGKWGVPK